MRLTFAAIFLIISILSLAQNSITVDLTLDNSWVTLASDWRYQRGDNPDWSSPAFDDLTWPRRSSINLNRSDSIGPIADLGEIAWFRKEIQFDSDISDPIVMVIFQSGASEIYLDGNLIRRSGVISSEITEARYENPWDEILHFPIIPGKKHNIAVRFLNLDHPFPLYDTNKGGIRLLATSFSNAISTNTSSNFLAETADFVKGFYLMAGIAAVMFTIFITLYLFFPNQRINGYYALLNLLLALSIFFIIKAETTRHQIFWLEFAGLFAMELSMLLLLFCTYKVLEQKVGFIFKVLLGLFFASLVLPFFIRLNYAGQVYIITVSVSFIRVSLISLRRKRVAALIFISAQALMLIGWIILLFEDYGMINAEFSFYSFTSVILMILPISVAINLGYDFGKQNQSLQQQIKSNKKLAKDKQSILRNQNNTLERLVTERTNDLTASLENLKSTQTQLIHSEKMASLGELTAGIAHEIQNPLNFVNNFSELNQELVEEQLAALGKKDVREAKTIANDIKENEAKINHHGKRAEEIVKSMLQHSRGGDGEKELTDINLLAHEYLRLAYHGLRAKDKSFNAEFECSLDENLPKIKVVPQDIGRVLLNLINNAFQAVSEKAKALDNGFIPKVEVITYLNQKNLEVTIKDNGPGIPAEIKEKIFQPFFTTKPTGEGTGLGLSMSFDIITKGHNGKIELQTSEGETKFIISLPID